MEEQTPQNEHDEKHVTPEPIENSAAGEDALFVNKPLEIAGLPLIDDEAFSPLHKEYLYVRLVSALVFFAFLAAAGVLLYFNTDLAIWQIYLPLVVIATFNITVQILGFSKKGYLMRTHDISYKRGLIFHKRTTVPLVRIQHSEVSQGPLQRLFDLATVKIYTAGGQQSDLSIPGLTPTEAGKVRDYINKLVREHAEG